MNLVLKMFVFSLFCNEPEVSFQVFSGFVFVYMCVGCLSYPNNYRKKKKIGDLRGQGRKSMCSFILYYKFSLPP